MHLPSVDIVIAAHNEERHLRQCLNSLREQEYPDDRFEIYVVDDGSDDQTAKIATECGVNLLRQQKRGAAAARNAGIRAGTGQLIGLLDAHCYIQNNWVRVMAEQFADPQVGGCQARINNQSDDKRVQKYLDSTRTLSNDQILTDTVKGDRNLYPWILSGNSMYRRSAVEEAGFFNEILVACEDVDLAWRVVLLGYHLRYASQAEATHYDHNSWLGFIRKGFRYGAGAAQLSQIYKAHGAKARNNFSGVLTLNLEQSLSAIFYSAGFNLKILRMGCGLDNPHSTQPLSTPLERFRPVQRWDDERCLQVSSAAVYWFNEPDRSVIVNVTSKQRIVLQSTGNFIWRRIVGRLDRSELIEQLSEHYNVSTLTAGSDLDEFVEELIDAGVIATSAVGHADSLVAGVA